MGYISFNANTVFEYENTIGKLTFAFDSAFWLTEVEGMSGVEVDIFATRNAGQSGSSISSQSIRPRAFSIDGVIFDPIGENREELVRIMAPEVPSTLTIKEGSQSWYLDVYPSITPEIGPGDGEQPFQVQLYAAYPYWRSTESYNELILGLASMFKFPFYTGGTWWISKFSDNFFKEIINDGNSAIGFHLIFEARGPLTNPEIIQVETGKFIKTQNLSMATGERFVISTMEGKKSWLRIDKFGKATNGYRHMVYGSSLEMALEPGINTFRADAQTNRGNLSVTMRDTPKGVRSGV